MRPAPKTDLMLNCLITSQTRIRLLKKFFLNSKTTAHLRGLESEFGESSNGIRIELNRFEEAGLLTSKIDGNKKLYQANEKHPLYFDIHNIIIKETVVEKIIENVIDRIGNLICVYLTGEFASGTDSEKIELILVGDHIDTVYLMSKIKKAENITGRKITYTLVDTTEAEHILCNFKPSELLPLWNCEAAI